MIVEVIGSVALGLALAWLAFRRLPHRLPTRRLVLATGVSGALFGDFITRTALGSGHTLVTLLGAAAVSVALLSLLVRPAGRVRRSATA